jgi:hypothetical protein
MMKKCAIETYPCIVGVVMRAAGGVPFRNLETLSAFAGNADVTIRSNRNTPLTEKHAKPPAVEYRKLV